MTQPNPAGQAERRHPTRRNRLSGRAAGYCLMGYEQARPPAPERRHRVRRSYLAVLVGVLSVGLVGAGLSALLAYWMLHPPTKTTGETPADYGLAFEEVSFSAADGVTLRGWYLPGRNGATVLWVHGFARDRSELLPEASWLVERGYGALLFDLRAQGASGGAHITLGYLEALDVQAAVDWILSRSPGERVGALGYSMGAVAAIRAAAVDEGVRAVVVVSPYADLRQLADQRLGVWRFLAPLVVGWGEWMSGVRLDDLRPLEDVTRLSPRPILILQAEADKMVPLDSGWRLYQAAGQPKELWSVPGVGHVDFRQAVPEAYRERLLAFFDRYLLGDGYSSPGSHRSGQGRLGKPALPEHRADLYRRGPPRSGATSLRAAENKIEPSRQIDNPARRSINLGSHLQLDDRILAAKGVGDVGVGLPVVLPALSVQQIAETIAVSGFEG